MARPGLYDELQRLGLVDKARIVCGADGSDTDKASQIDLLIGEAGGDFNVTPRAVFILRHRLEDIGPLRNEADTKTGNTSPHRSPAPRKPEPGPTNDGRPRPKPPPGPHKSAFKKGNPGGPGGPPGNDKATVTGVRRNPLLHGVRPDQVKLAQVDPNATAQDLILDSISRHRLSIIDMNAEIEAIKASKERWWWLGSTYTRQEGDGEIMGTGRISSRKRIPRGEALKTMIDALARVQSRMDKAIADYHRMQQDDKGQRKQGLGDLLGALKAKKAKKGNE